MKSIKPALLTYGFSRWGGGIDIIRHFANYLNVYQPEECEVKGTIILPKEQSAEILKNCLYPYYMLGKQLIKGEPLKLLKRPRISIQEIRKEFQSFSSEFKIVRGGSTIHSQIESAARSGAEVVFPCIDVPEQSCLPWVGYLYDFQHVHLPEFFLPEEILKRNISFRNMLEKSSDIVVYAQSVADNAKDFCPESQAILHVLPFSPSPENSWLETNYDAREKYGIKSPYFLISNQFWRHKDHATAFNAFAKYIDYGGEMLLVCTGQTYDYRFPTYFDELLALLKELGVESRVKILGYIPKFDQISLVKFASAVIQPSLFEGAPGGGASYNAVSLGTPVIASNIAVNLEMDCGDLLFFKASNYHSLADAMYSKEGKTFVKRNYRDLWEQGIMRRRRAAEVITNAMLSSIANSKF